MLIRPHASPTFLATFLTALLAGLAAAFLIPTRALAQTSPDSTPTLTINTRLVIEDVLVTNRDGRPVHGLPATSFHVTDNGTAQSLLSFEEGSSASPASLLAPLPLGTFSSMASTDAHSASEVLLIDADSMRVEDQNYLLNQLDKALLTVPANLQIAVFRIANGRVVQIRSLGNDRADTRRALRECLPILTHAIDDPFNSAVDQLLTVASFLQQTPGRKNILWLAGSFPLVSFVEGEGPAGSKMAARLHVLHELQESLAEARVSVYPVDVRGVIPIASQSAAGTLSPAKQSSSPGMPLAGTLTSAASAPLGPPAESVIDQRNQMCSLALATGGRAYTLNHIGEEVSEAFDLGARAYSLSYTPTSYVTDNSWHRVSITVDPTTPGGPFQLSYRPGYLASWSAVPGGRVGVRLAAHGPQPTSGNPADDPSLPLFFTVRIEPGLTSAGRDSPLPLAIHFLVPVDEVAFKRSGGQWRNELVIASLAYNAEGRIETSHLQQWVTTLSDEQFALAHHLNLPATQTLTVPGNLNYLMLEVRDTTTRRVGNLMLPMRAVRALPPATRPVP